MELELKDADKVTTWPFTTLGLVGGFLVASETHVRALGGAVLGLAGLYAGRTWLSKRGPGTTTALSAIYLGGFGASHALAKQIGAWPSVFTVAAVSGVATWALADRDK